MNNQPTLPSAKPAKALMLTLSGLSLAMLVAGIGLGAIATGTYQTRAENRIDRDEQLTALEQKAEVRQRSAQLKRDYSAPVWIADASFHPDHKYDTPGVRKVRVPVLVGFELDTAVCIGSMGPEGFTQNTDDPLCLGY